jgi:hypothetical protein
MFIMTLGDKTEFWKPNEYWKRYKRRVEWHRES